MTTQSEPEITYMDMAGLESINWTATKTERISSTTLNSSNGPKKQRAVTTKGQVDMKSQKSWEIANSCTKRLASLCWCAKRLFTGLTMICKKLRRIC